MPVLRVLIAAGVALALADASVVTLALPPMLGDLDTTVEGVAAVIGVYTLVLARCCRSRAGVRRRAGDALPGAAGFGVFALAGALCSLPDDLAACSRSGRCRRRAPPSRWSRRSRCWAAAGSGPPPPSSARRSGPRSAAC